MSSWGDKRRNNIIAFISIVLIIISIAISFYFLFKEGPTCFDKLRNGDEQGVDCGGSCEILCKDLVLPPIIHWQRHFKVGEFRYNTVAYIENLNTNAGSENVSYVFKLYDDKNVLIAERFGVFDIKPKEKVPVLEAAFDTGKLDVHRITFDIQEDNVWKREEPRESRISVINQKSYNDNGLPKIDITIKNDSVRYIEDIDVVLIVYDEEDNALNVSSSFIDYLDGGSTQKITYTWSAEFEKPIFRFEVIPLYE